MKTSSGAGANADSRIDTTPVEHRTENIPSCPWDAGSSNTILLPTCSMRSRGTSDDKSTGDRKITKLQVELTVSSEAGPLFGSSRAHHSGLSCDMVEANPVLEESALHFIKKQECNYEEQALCCRNDVQSKDVATRSKIEADG